MHICAGKNTHSLHWVGSCKAIIRTVTVVTNTSVTSTKRLRRCSPSPFHIEETVVSTITTSVVEVAAAETTVDFSDLDTVGSVTPSLYTVVVGEKTTGQAETLTYTVTVNGQGVEVTGTTDYVTTFTFDETVLSLSFGSRQTAFKFTGATSVDVTIPPEHTHLTVNGVETAIDLPGVTTVLEVSESTNVILDLSEATTEVTFTAESVEFTFTTLTVDGDALSMCGTYSLTGGNGAASDHCVPGFTTTITLPSAAAQSTVYLHATGLQTAFPLPGITTTFVRGCVSMYTSCGVFHRVEAVGR